MGCYLCLIINDKQHYHRFRYFPAILRASDGRMTNMVANKSLINISVRAESGVSGPPAVITIKIPTTPKKTDE